MFNSVIARSLAMDPTHMLSEVRSAPAVVATQQHESADVIAGLAAQLSTRPPRSIFTVARGSSDHAASYLAFLAMSRLGIPATSLPMSLVTLYNAPIEARESLAIAISQSGESPDVVDTMRYLRRQGATTAALVNRLHSPLARACEWAIPLHAGIERSVAATKSFVASVNAAAQLIAQWQQDAALLSALAALPERLEQAETQDWSAALEALRDIDRMVVVGRGLGFAIAQEAALKLKETCGIQAEPFSGAELRHGPLALVGPGYPLLVLAPAGPAQEGLLALADDMRAHGARVIVAAPAQIAQRSVTLTGAGHPDIDPIAAIQGFYLMVEQLSCLRGMDPDRPPGLKKVTLTL